MDGLYNWKSLNAHMDGVVIDWVCQQEYKLKTTVTCKEDC